MKPFGVVVFAAVIIACSQVSAQQKSRGMCPAADGIFGICVFDPNVNCVEDAQCQGGQLCCPHGCNRICKDPVFPPSPPRQEQGLIIKQCPAPSGAAGICVFDENRNCLSDQECKGGQMCCSEGCNKICKDPVTFQPLRPEPKVPTSRRN